MGNIHLLLTAEVRKAFWFTVEADCNFTFHWVGRKWALPHYITRLVFVLNPHPSELSELLKAELLGFFPEAFSLYGLLFILPVSCPTHWFISFPLRDSIVSSYDGHFKFANTTRSNLLVQRQKRVLLLCHPQPTSMTNKFKIS
jgi:hypothetical protein